MTSSYDSDVTQPMNHADSRGGGRRGRDEGGREGMREGEGENPRYFTLFHSAVHASVTPRTIECTLGIFTAYFARPQTSFVRRKDIRKYGGLTDMTVTDKALPDLDRAMIHGSL